MKFWPFRRSEPAEAPPVVFDDDALDRAIRAGCPIPLEWFLAQTPEVQETIAARRDAWLDEVGVSFAFAALDPERMRLALLAEGGDEEAEGALDGLNAQAVAAALADRLQNAAPEAAPEPEPRRGATMGGHGRRVAERAAARLAERPGPAPFGAKETRREAFG